ncbi:MAG: AAA family ATPase, partial [Chitinophagaceae bacterium]
MNQEDKNNKFTFNDKNGEEPKKGAGRKGPKFNIYWIYAIIFAALIASNFFNLSPDLNAITQQEFENEMLAKGDVEKIELVRNKELVRIYIKPESVTKDYYVQKFKRKVEPASIKGAPLFSFKITDWKAFTDQMKEFYAKNPSIKEVSTTVVDDGDFFNSPLVSTIITVLIFVGLWVLLMRKMGGPAGGGGPGGIFNIGKSKATLFEKGTKVSVNFGDVAGLDEAKVEVMEIVDFLKNPKKYTSLGGK